MVYYNVVEVDEGLEKAINCRGLAGEKGNRQGAVNGVIWTKGQEENYGVGQRVRILDIVFFIQTWHFRKDGGTWTGETKTLLENKRIWV